MTPGIYKGGSRVGRTGETLTTYCIVFEEDKDGEIIQDAPHSFMVELEDMFDYSKLQFAFLGFDRDPTGFEVSYDGTLLEQYGDFFSYIVELHRVEV